MSENQTGYGRLGAAMAREAAQRQRLLRLCRSCGHHFDHHRAYNVYCAGGDGKCRCEHYWAADPRLQGGMGDPGREEGY